MRRRGKDRVKKIGIKIENDYFEIDWNIWDIYFLATISVSGADVYTVGTEYDPSDSQ